jgi:hypothetical protein
VAAAVLLFLQVIMQLRQPPFRQWSFTPPAEVELSTRCTRRRWLPASRRPAVLVIRGIPLWVGIYVTIPI